MPAQIGMEREARSRVKLTGRVTCRDKTSTGTVVDLSDAGMNLQLAYDIKATQGQAVIIDTEELGRLNGMVQWARGDQIGVRLMTSSNTSAKIASYYKLFR
ncbi:PilZ domain-containing protein [Rhizobium sp. PP-F2F-G38]|uniref:PilZ domain-containing protein n=1 Tax=Rhizobium sp. PP-CC-3G-465 TaxID=2135648 RepID=UPI000D87F1EB|nr:PilZ domain-containing protein [Rhizobium sp. PP-WC-1G-195]PYF00519.1 PilZ domain-containing protein [Rhizobium sp. PP-F2F-G38]TCQ09760.1 PilZ domain-containing protein [Rhizobium sp. PP-F2F-G36]TCQ28155.1 PilZ domain-containing protein [Rhizobium sp. PP-CC-3G-465]